MSGVSQAHRSLDYAILSTCERLSLTEERFFELPYDSQLRLLAFHQLRLLDEQHMSHSL